jgi:hypothetical protein
LPLATIAAAVVDRSAVSMVVFRNEETGSVEILPKK